MLVLRAIRLAWAGLLAVMPGPVVARLDAWASGRARKRARRRLQRLLATQR